MGREKKVWAQPRSAEFRVNMASRHVAGRKTCAALNTFAWFRLNQESEVDEVGTTSLS